MEKISVKIKEEKNFSIYLDFPIERIGSKIKKLGNKFLLLSDFHVYSLFGNKIKESIKRENKKIYEILIPQGESQKNIANVIDIIEKMVQFKISRDDTIINLGGGVISDIGGFIASIYMRGLNYITIPTTLLAQVDAAIGGKTGVNLEYGKNLVGSFYQPIFIFIDFKTLSTLPYSEIKQGIAEIIKYGVIKNKKIFEKLENLQIEEIENYYKFLVKESIKIKIGIIRKDEKEKKNIREILNFGHTIGHGIEISNLEKFSHGDAVSLGMICESYIGYKLNLCDKDIYLRIKELAKKFKLNTSFDSIVPERIVKFLKHDKKIRKETLRFVLPEKIGKVKVGIELGEETVLKILKELKWNN